jgi:hypothetical protein
MLRRVALIRNNVSGEPSVAIIRVTRIGQLGTTSAVTSNRRTLRAKLLVTADDGGNTFLRNVGSYKNHMV